MKVFGCVVCAYLIVSECASARKKEAVRDRKRGRERGRERERERGRKGGRDLPDRLRDIFHTFEMVLAAFVRSHPSFESIVLHNLSHSLSLSRTRSHSFSLLLTKWTSAHTHTHTHRGKCPTTATAAFTEA